MPGAVRVANPFDCARDVGHGLHGHRLHADAHRAPRPDQGSSAAFEPSSFSPQFMHFEVKLLRPFPCARREKCSQHRGQRAMRSRNPPQIAASPRITIRAM